MFPHKKNPHSRQLFTNPIRPAVRAILVKNGKILLVKLNDRLTGAFFVLPGGGQKHGEQMADTVRRECAEELGILVAPKKLCYVREYIGANHEFAAHHKYFHQIEVVFECDLLDDSRLGNGSEEDVRQIGYEWVPIADLPHTRICPSIFKTFVVGDHLEIPYGTYFGDTN